MGAVKKIQELYYGYESLKTLFGDRFIDSPSVLESYSADLQGAKVLPLCIVYPVNEQEITTTIGIANKDEFQLYTISCGKNWGYGSAQGTKEGQVIMDLSRMNKIEELNESLNYVTIQPGVTQGQLYKYLQTTNSGLQMDVTGAGGSASIVGNILERGFGHTEYGDKYNTIINMKVILPNGKAIQTGYGGLSNAKAKNVYRYGIGPCIDGLFSQSNLGIVTEMTIRLSPKPDHVNVFVAKAKGKEAYLQLSQAAKELQLNNIVTSKMHIANSQRSFAKQQTKQEEIWIISGNISGPFELSKAKEKLVKKIIRKYSPKTRIIFFTKKKIKLLSFIYNKLYKFPLYKDIIGIYHLLTGVPTERPIQVLFADDLIYGATIEKTQHHVKWINCVCPNDTKMLKEAIGHIEAQSAKHNYQPGITLTSINPTALIILATIKYNKDNKEEEYQAEKFAKQLKNSLAQQGYFPYRSGVGEYQQYETHMESNSKKFLQQLKAIIDPHKILAPGKYNL